MKRTLKPWVQNALIITGIYLILKIRVYDNCTAEGLPAFLGMTALVVIIAVILGKWGSWRQK